MVDEENVSHEKTETTQAVERPEYIPEKFWDADSKSANIEALATSYNALEKKFGARTEDLAKSVREDIANEVKANAPEEYKLEPPESLPEGVDFQVKDETPILEWW